MAVILSLSSQVVRGHVGNSVLVPGLMALGHEVWPLPTVTLSNHPGHGASAGRVTDAGDMEAMLDTLDSHGWLAQCDAILTGYFRDASQCEAAAHAVDAVRRANPQALYCCDPVLGDDPGGLYVPEDVAAAVRDVLLPRADLATPNRFELSWLSGMNAGTGQEAIAAARKLAAKSVIATSIPHADQRANVWISEDEASLCPFEPLEGVPHGVGDLLAGLALAGLLEGCAGGEGLGLATAQVAHVIAPALGRDELDLQRGLEGLRDVGPWACEDMGHP